MVGAANLTRRTLAAISSVRHVNLTFRPHKRVLSVIDSNNIKESTLESDSHADTCCVGSDCLVINDYDRPVTVYGYDKTMGAQHFRTVSAAVAYVHPVSGTYSTWLCTKRLKFPI